MERETSSETSSKTGIKGTTRTIDRAKMIQSKRPDAGSILRSCHDPATWSAQHLLKRGRAFADRSAAIPLSSVVRSTPEYLLTLVEPTPTTALPAPSRSQRT